MGEEFSSRISFAFCVASSEIHTVSTEHQRLAKYAADAQRVKGTIIQFARWNFQNKNGTCAQIENTCSDHVTARADRSLVLETYYDPRISNPNHMRF